MKILKVIKIEDGGYYVELVDVFTFFFGKNLVMIQELDYSIKVRSKGVRSVMQIFFLQKRFVYEITSITDIILSTEKYKA